MENKLKTKVEVLEQVWLEFGSPIKIDKDSYHWKQIALAAMQRYLIQYKDMEITEVNGIIITTPIKQRNLLQRIKYVFTNK